MLTIRFGAVEDTLINVDAVFDNNYEDEWFTDSLVKEMILDVDKSVVVSAHTIESPVLRQIPPSSLSGGVKALILMLKEDWEVWATACGDNCAKWILEIGKQRDLTISLEHFMKFPTYEFDFIDAITGKFAMIILSNI